MKIIAKKVKCKHLMPGDLFSTYGQEEWNDLLTHKDANGLVAIGQRAYIRTDAPCPVEQRDFDIYRIRIVHK